MDVRRSHFYDGNFVKENYTAHGMEEHIILHGDAQAKIDNIKVSQGSSMRVCQSLTDDQINKERAKELQSKNLQKKIRTIIEDKNIIKNPVVLESILEVDAQSTAENVTIGKGSRVYILSGTRVKNLKVGDYCFVYLRNWTYPNDKMILIDELSHCQLFHAPHPCLIDVYQADSQKKFDEYEESLIQNFERSTQLSREELGFKG